MGVDTNLLINSGYNPKDVVKLLKGLSFKVEKEEHNGDHSFIIIQGESRLRQIYVARSQEYGGLDATFLSMRSDQESINILKMIASVTGGMLREMDTDSVWEDIDSPHQGNSYFLIKHMVLEKAIADGHELSDAVDTAIESYLKSRESK